MDRWGRGWRSGRYLVIKLTIRKLWDHVAVVGPEKRR